MCLQALVALIRAGDPVRAISSGYSLPRPSAWHQEHCPVQGGPCPADPNPHGGGYWGLDTPAQFLQMLAWQNTAVDLWSVHHYAQAASATSECYFSRTACVRDASLVTMAATHAASLSRAVFVGEYGGPAPDFTGPSTADQAFPASILTAQVNATTAGGTRYALPLTALWAWACPSHRSDMACVWPNSTRPQEIGSNRMVALLAAANAAMEAEMMADVLT